MKLRNKKTGEIVNVDFVYPETAEFFYPNFKLVDFNELFEDYEEPKSFWTINTTFDCAEPIVSVIEISERYYNDKDAKSIGNYFETKEEAEKAVEKLKAWKRLKDKGFEFNGWCDRGAEPSGDMGFRMPKAGQEWSEDEIADLDLLFSGGEE